MDKKQYLLAHRGYSGIAPENTHLAFEMAYQYNFDGVELDVHLTKDNHIVIIHDETTKRTAGTKKTIATSYLKDLKEDDHGYFFKYSTAKQEIMTLEEFLDLYIDKFNFINVEIKTDEYEYENIEKYIHELMQKYGDVVFEKIIFSSFNFKSLEKMFNFNEKYLLGFLWWKQKEFKKINKEEIAKICSFLHPWIKLYDNKKYINEYLSLNKPFLLWTIKDEKKFKSYINDEKVFAQISNYKYKK